MKNISISIAFILSVLGLGALAAAYCVGSLVAGDRPVTAACVAIILFIAGFVASLFAIQAKQTRPDFRKWRYIEVIAVIAMIAVGAFMIRDGAITGFNYVFQSKDLQTKANHDVDALTAQIAGFQLSEADKLNHTVKGLELVLAGHATGYSNVAPDLKVFILQNVMGAGEGISTLSANKIRDFRNSTATCIESLSSSEADNNTTAFYTELQHCKNVIASWSPADVAQLTDALNANALKISVQLNSLAATLPTPQIKSEQGMFVLVPKVPETYVPNVSTFAASYGELYSFENPTSDLLAGICFLLFICNYLLSYRSIALGVGRTVKISDNHGIPLC